MMMNWADLEPDDLVLGKDGYTWKVTAHAKAGGGSFKVTLVRDGRKPFSTNVSGQVETVWTKALEAERAEALMQVHLGGETTGRKGPNGVFLTPAAFTDPGSLLGHAYIFHGQIGDGMASLDTLRRWHDELHKHPDGITPHHHDPDFYKANR